MRAALLTLVAMMLFAMQNITIERKLSGVPTAALLTCFYAVTLPLAILRWIHLNTTDASAMFPSGTTLVLSLGAGLMLFFGDYCYFSAYTTGGSAISITTIGIMLPIFVSLGTFLMTRSTPNGYQILGYIFAVAAVFLVAKGSPS